MVTLVTVYGGAVGVEAMQNIPGLRTLVLGCAWLVAVSCSAMAGPVVLDQSTNPLPPGTFAQIDATRDRAQTFTVGTAGRLSRIELGVELSTQLYPDIPGLIVEVRTTDGFAPTLLPIDPLATFFFEAAAVPERFSAVNGDEFLTVDVSGADIFVQPGDQLAIALSVPRDAPPRNRLTPSVVYSWRLANPYDLGERFRRTVPRSDGPPPLPDVPWTLHLGVSDKSFRTFVEIPEPAGVSLLLGSLALLSRRTR